MRQARLRKGIELCFDERGSGEPVVMIMGIGVQMIYWHEEMCDLLADAGFRVIPLRQPRRRAVHVPDRARRAAARPQRAQRR